jgi:two-component system, chemotaxis family, response regulator Rcp1
VSKAVQILVADDNDADVLLLREVLAEHQLAHELHVITDGEEALQFAGVAGENGTPPCPDLFVLDLHLPRISGSDVLRRFRSNQHCAKTPVIVFSGSALAKDRATVEAFPGVSFVRKPTGFDDFMKVGEYIKKVLAEKSEAI